MKLITHAHTCRKRRWWWRWRRWRRKKRKVVGGGGGMWSEGEKVEVCTKQNNGKQSIESGRNNSLCERNQFVFERICASHFSKPYYFSFSPSFWLLITVLWCCRLRKMKRNNNFFCCSLHCESQEKKEKERKEGLWFCLLCLLVQLKEKKEKKMHHWIFRIFQFFSVW